MCFDDMVFSTANQIHFVQSLQVDTNGYFSFGTRQTVASPSLFSSTSPYNYLVAPFWADIDISIHGSISYEVHNTSAGSSSIALLNRVSTFISNQQNTQFSGNWMLVASWSQVSAYSGSSLIVSGQHFISSWLDLSLVVMSPHTPTSLSQQDHIVHSNVEAILVAPDENMCVDTMLTLASYIY